MSEAEQPPTPPPAESSPPSEAKPPETKPPQRGGKPGFRRPQGPPRRERAPVPTLEETQRFGSGPKLKDLDDEIAAELEAALGGMSSQELYAAEKSEDVRQKAATSADGGRKQGTVHSVHGPDVFVDIPGGRSQGVLPLEQFPEGTPKPGTVVEVHIEGFDGANGLLLLTRKGAAVTADWSSVAVGMTVEARVIETNKGGLAVDINGIRGFMPISQIDMYRVEQPEQFVNQRLKCMISEVDAEHRNLVVSRRALLEKEREEQREKLWAELAEGQIREGIVRSIREFGAFVDLGGGDGLLHVSEMSWKRVDDPSQIVQPGQSVKVVVLKVDRDKRKVSLGLKQLQASPWDNIRERYHPLQIVPGTVTRLMDFGAFVEIEPGVEGLVHVSELARQKVWRVADIVQPGQEVQVKVLSIDEEQRRISLSLKEALAPEPVKKAEDEEEEESAEVQPPRPRTTPLRGGVGHDEWAPSPPQE
jgi:small subunit ribosomal protein S1